MPVPTLTVMAARRLRRALTPPEARLWALLRGRRLEGLRFRRQHPIGPYVLDFYCRAAHLAVEVDGAAHDSPDQLRRDAARDAWLAAQGLRVLRIPAREVRDHIDGVLALIELTAKTSPPPTQCGGGGGDERRPAQQAGSDRQRFGDRREERLSGAEAGPNGGGGGRPTALCEPAPARTPPPQIHRSG